PGDLVLPGPEHPGSVRLRLSARNRRAAGSGADGLRGLDGGLAGRSVVDLRSAQQPPAQGTDSDRMRTGRVRRSYGYHLRRTTAGVDDRASTGGAGVNVSAAARSAEPGDLDGDAQVLRRRA